MKKQSFLLLELIIALSIVGFVSYLLILYPYEQMKEEWRLLSSMENQRKIELDLWKIKELAYTQAPEWQKEKTTDLPFDGRSYRIVCSQTEKSDELKKYFLIRVHEKSKKTSLVSFYVEVEKEKPVK